MVLIADIRPNMLFGRVRKNDGTVQWDYCEFMGVDRIRLANPDGLIEGCDG